MKKQLFSILAVAALAMGFTSCSKDDPATPVNVDTTKTATINGIAHATIDRTSSAIQFAPNGTKIFIKIPYSSLSTPSASGYYVVETTVGADGKFTAQVPATNNGVTATVQGDQFTATATLPGPVSENQKFQATATSTPTLQIGATTFITVEYGTGTTYR